jgi:hypothetical protein
MGHHEQPFGMTGVERNSFGRPFDGEPGAAEDEQVEVELTRTPPTTEVTTEGLLESLQRDEQRNGAGGRVWPGGRIHRDDGVAEWRLVLHPHRFRLVQPGDASEPDAGKRRQRPDGGLERGVGIADIGPQADVRPNPPTDQSDLLVMLGAMSSVAVRVLHRDPGPSAGPLERWLADIRLRLAGVQADRFRKLGAGVEIEHRPTDDTSFGARLRDLAWSIRSSGIVVLGSGSVPLARADDLEAFLETAAARERVALANNRYSADIVGIAGIEPLREVPDLPSDNALPRWLEEVAGYRVDDLRQRWRLGIDLDSPLDVLIVSPDEAAGLAAPTRHVLAGLADIAHDRRAELVVAGRTSAATLAWLERSTKSRIRALVEERGLRASSQLATTSDGTRTTRPPRSILGAMLDRDGPESLGARLAELGDAAVVDTRVLLAHRLGADERAWPSAEDRFASDLLLHERIDDPWLKALTTSAAQASIPIALGGHSLVGPALRLVVRQGRWT